MAGMHVDMHTKRQVLYLNVLEYDVFHRCLCYINDTINCKDASKE